MLAGLRDRARRRPRLAAAAALAVITCAWFWPLLTGDQLGQSYTLNRIPPWAGAVDAGSLPERAPFFDAAIAFHPWIEVAKHQLADGQLPMWNPTEWGGTTLAGNLQSALFFPLTWPLLLLPFGYAWGLVAMAKTFVAGFGAFSLARELRVGTGGAVVAGAVYMLSGPLTLWLQFPLGSAFALFPWLVLATAQLIRTGATSRSVSALALATGLVVLAGHPESALICVSAAGVYLLVAGGAARVRRRGRMVAAWVAGLLLGGALAAVALVPFVHALAGSITAGGRAELLPDDRPSVAGLLQFAMPGLFGNGEPGIYGSPFGYFGTPALLLACVGLWLRRRDPHVLGLIGMAAVTVAVVYRLPPLNWVLDHVPPWSVSYLVGQRTYFVVALVGAVGAGIAVTRLSLEPLRLRTVVKVAGGVALLLVAALAFSEVFGVLRAPADVKQRSIAFCAVLLLAGAAVVAALGRLPRRASLPLALVTCVLALVGLQDLNVTLPREQAYPREPPSVTEIRRQPGVFRVGVIRNTRRSPFGRLTLLPNTASLYGLESIEGYDFPLSRRWADFEGSVLRYGGSPFPELRLAVRPPDPAALRALRSMNVRYYLAPPGTPSPNPSLRVLYRGSDAVVFVDPEALPRAYVVPTALPASRQAALARLARGEFTPRREALVEQGSPSELRAGGPFRAAPVARPAPDRTVVTLPPGSSGWLVLANAYHRGWRAEVDGRPVEPRATNLAATGVPVRRGDRTVVFSMDRTPFWAGATVSALALALCALLALKSRPRRSD